MEEGGGGGSMQIIWKGEVRLKRGRVWKKHFVVVINGNLLTFMSEEASRIEKPVQQIKFKARPFFANCVGKKKNNCFKLLFQDELHVSSGPGDSLEYQYAHARIDDTSHKLQFLQALKDATKHLVTSTGHADQRLSISTETEGRSQTDESPMEDISVEMIPETAYVLDEMHERRKICNTHSSKRNQNMLFSMARQLWDSPGLELSKVSLPAFVFEPMSFLEKLTEPLFHGYLLAKANKEREALERMKLIIKIHFASLYDQQTKYIKKCYNPILGEIHRSYWEHAPKNRTYFIAENVSHHPPIQALYAVNRREGFSMEANTEIEPKLHANSVVAKFGGKVVYRLHAHNEEYITNCPDGMGRNVLMGAFIFEFIGNTFIRCESSGYRVDLEFRHKNVWKLWQPDMTHTVVGTVTKHGDLIGTVCGKWNEIMYYTHKGSKEQEVLWDSNAERRRMLPYYVVDPSHHMDTESRRIWAPVNDALLAGDDQVANTEKVVIEERERSHRRLREQNMETFTPKLFKQDSSGFYSYAHKCEEPWNDETEDCQFEHGGIIGTRYKHQSAFLRSIREMDEIDNGSEHSPQISANESSLTRLRRRPDRPFSEINQSPTEMIITNHVEVLHMERRSTSVQCLLNPRQSMLSEPESHFTAAGEIEGLRTEMSQLTTGINALQDRMTKMQNTTNGLTTKQLTILSIFVVIAQMSVCFLLAKDKFL